MAAERQRSIAVSVLGASLIPLTSVCRSHLCIPPPNVHPETGFCSTDEKEEKNSTAK